MRNTLISLALAALLPMAAHAQLVNGSFEQGLHGWTPHGDVSAQQDGSSAWLRLSTAFDEGDDAPWNASGVAALAVGMPGGLEGAAGLPLGAMDAVAGPAYEGAYVQQTFSVAHHGGRIGFRWNLSTRDTDFADRAFVVLNGRLSWLADGSQATLPGAADMLWQTGMQSVSLLLPGPGVYTLGFGVVDVGDFTGVSVLSLHGVEVTQVPEPGTLTLGLGGLLALAALRRRRT